jgi:hypothetical protein
MEKKINRFMSCGLNEMRGFKVLLNFDVYMKTKNIIIGVWTGCTVL